LWRPGRPWRGSIAEALRAPEVRTVAIANPATAPYGFAAMQVLERLGIVDDAAFGLVRGESIGQAFQFIASGNADLGFVALAQLIEFDVLNGRDARTEAHVVDAALHDPIVQEAVWLRRSRSNPAAGEFLDFVRDQGRAIIVEAGYAVPSAD
jgi:molybdate transport system substrate-binding protein